MDRVTDVTRDCFNALAQVREADGAALPAPEQLHARLRSFVEDLLRRAAAAGFGREEANDLAYAVVALADELVLSKESEDLRLFWSAQPLQLHFFQENVAGEAFFTRLEAIRRDPRRAELVRAYYLALLFGFQGRYRVRGGELELLSLVDGLARELARGRASDLETLSPSGERPDGSVRGAARAGPILWISAGALVLALALYVGLRVNLATGTDAVVGRIAATATP
jgi:type VI secretion system protein ImpK